MKGFITYDYELCLGDKTGTPEGCLVEPMQALTSMFAKYGVRVNIFVDAAYLLRMEELRSRNIAIQKDYDTVLKNIEELSSLGHSIQLHFHPQWINAKYLDGKWMLDNSHYKLSDLPLEEQIDRLSAGLNILQAVSQNEIVAYRAGGFSLENFGQLSSFFKEKGIKFDTSVLRGGYVKSVFQEYDYRDIPMLTSYPFSDSIKRKNANGQFVEYPISVEEINSIKYLFLKRFTKRNKEKKFSSYSPSRWNDGVGIGQSSEAHKPLSAIIKRLFSKSPLYASADGALVYFLSNVYHYCKARYDGDDFVIIGHPKIASPRTIAALEEFIVNHLQDIDFKVFHEI